MNWLRRALSPQHRWWVIYFFVLVPLLIAAHWYKGSFGRRQLTRLASSAGRAPVDKEELSKLKMERSGLDFQLPNLRAKYPLLTNAALARDWSAASLLSQLDPEVCQSWRAYLARVSPLVLHSDPSLQNYVTVQEGYENAVERLARDPFAKDKRARLLNLRTNQFGPLFTQPEYFAAALRFDDSAQKIADPQTVALRAAYHAAIASSVTNLNSRLQSLARATLDYQADCDTVRQRIQQLDEKLAVPGVGPGPSPVQTAQSDAPLTAQPPATLETVATWPSLEKDFFILDLSAGILGFFITLPLELRDRRWLKILACMGLVHVGLLALRVPPNLTEVSSAHSALRFFGYVIPAVLLAALWTSDLKFFFSKPRLHLVGSPRGAGTETTSFRPVYQAVQQGNPSVALQLVEARLLAEPTDYEALLLKVRLLRQLKHRWRTKWTLKKLLRSDSLGAVQREQAEELLRNLDSPSLACWQPATSRLMQMFALEEDEELTE